MSARASRIFGLWLVVVVVGASSAWAVDYNIAVSLQVDYLYVPFAGRDPRPARSALDGFTEELSLKLALDLSSHASASVKLCYGCHGVEMDMGYVDYRFADELNFRFGRFNPTFGEFGLRHDPGNHRLSDKPLPYDMGRMLRMVDFNRSVLPSPYVDNGIEVSGSHFFGRWLQVDYAAHVVAGLRAPTDAAYDVDWVSMRSASPYYIDNNSAPSVGGRLGLTFRLAERVDLTVGGSALYGAYNNNGRLSYLVLGTDVFLRAGRTNLRAEYLRRRTEMQGGDAGRFEFQLPREANGVLADTVFQVKDGWYVELEHPLTRNLEVMLRWDGLRRIGNVAPGSPLDFDAGISRWTLGANYIIERGYRIKASLAHYSYWGLRSGVETDLAAHLGAVATF